MLCLSLEVLYEAKQISILRLYFLVEMRFKKNCMMICLTFIGSQLNNPYRNASIETGPDVEEEYISALYFVFTSLTTVGFGNIAPNSVVEKSFSVIVLVLGGM